MRASPVGPPALIGLALQVTTCVLGVLACTWALSATIGFRFFPGLVAAVSATVSAAGVLLHRHAREAERKDAE